MKADEDIADRIEAIILHYEMNVNSFSVAIGVKAPTTWKILKRENKPGYSYLCSILIRFNNINARWLLLGTGTIFSK